MGMKTMDVGDLIAELSRYHMRDKVAVLSVDEDGDPINVPITAIAPNGSDSEGVRVVIETGGNDGPFFALKKCRQEGFADGEESGKAIALFSAAGALREFIGKNECSLGRWAEGLSELASKIEMGDV